MKTPAFIPLILFLLLAVYAIAAPPMSKRNAAVAARTQCPKCLTAGVRFDSVVTITNVITQGTNAPRGTAEHYNLKCGKCGEKFRKIEVLPPSPPMPPGLPARSPADKR